MNILAVDPGGTSGYVRAEVDFEADDIRDLVSGGMLRVRRFGSWQGMLELEDLVVGGLFSELDVCVVERYVIYPNRASAHIGDDLYTARVIGRCEWLAYMHSGIDEVVFQAASQGKQRWPNSRLYKYMDGLVGMSDHVKDAVRHLMTYVELSL
jgi:hypothetical protein